MANSLSVNETAKPASQISKASGIPNDCLLITYYSDPLCCWSWASQNTLEQLLSEYKGRTKIRYVMSVLFSPEAPVKSALDMAAEWNFASKYTAIPIDAMIWETDPPTSSYQACLAVKTAALQSPEAERLCLQKMREAVMTRRMNISKNSVIIHLAEELSDEYPDDFKVLRFARDFAEEKARTHLEKDIYNRAYHGIEQLPTFRFTTSEGKKMLLSGYKPYDFVRNEISHMGL